jgi:hypothetical protein
VAASFFIDAIPIRPSGVVALNGNLHDCGKGAGLHAHLSCLGSKAQIKEARQFSDEWQNLSTNH